MRPSIATSPAIRMRSASRPSWGRKLFIGKARFIGYHNTPLFSDDDFHIIGLHIDTSLSPHADPTETGRSANQAVICNPAVADGDFNVNDHFIDDPHTTRDGNFCQQSIQVGLWRTKTLRQIAETAPYFRDGHAATLDDVIEFYDRGGDPPGTFLGEPKAVSSLHLSAAEKQWLKAFLETLTGDPVPPQYLRDCIIHNSWPTRSEEHYKRLDKITTINSPDLQGQIRTRTNRKWQSGTNSE